MAIKSIVVFVLIAFILTAALPSMSVAKTITSSQGDTNEKSAAGVAGPAVAANNSNPAPNKSSTRSSRKAARKSAVAAPPALRDPN